MLVDRVKDMNAKEQWFMLRVYDTRHLFFRLAPRRASCVLLALRAVSQIDHVLQDACYKSLKMTTA